MKIAWLYKEGSDDEWLISFTEPPGWAVDVRQIVYAELRPGEPS